MNHYLTRKITIDGVEITNIFERFKFVEKFKNNIKYYFDYDLSEGETPENVSFIHYGTTEWWWVITLFNDVYDPFYDWYLTTQEIEAWALQLIIDEYGTLTGHESEWQDKIAEIKTTNDAKASVKVVKPEYLPLVMKQIRTGL